MENLIAIISDYGLKDHYVGTVHGVIRDINPEAKIVDITIKIYEVVVKCSTHK
jgi:S-adenosylmethionine hydrolase